MATAQEAIDALAAKQGVAGSVTPTNLGAGTLQDIYDYLRQTSTGWGVYSDTQYTDGAPLTLVSDVKVNIPNNAGSSIETQIPIDVTTLYDGSVITGKNGDSLNLTISFSIRPTSAQATEVVVVPDIGGAVGEIKNYERYTIFSKGNGVTQQYLSSFGVYTLDTWEANGATLKITPDNPCEIFDIRYLIQRTHKAF